jgi:hypothetical protein
MTTLTRADRASWLETVWDALHGFREDCIPEGDSDFDRQWDDICTAMAWLAEELGADCPDDEVSEEPGPGYRYRDYAGQGEA